MPQTRYNNICSCRSEIVNDNETKGTNCLGKSLLYFLRVWSFRRRLLGNLILLKGPIWHMTFYAFKAASQKTTSIPPRSPLRWEAGLVGVVRLARASHVQSSYALSDIRMTFLSSFFEFCCLLKWAFFWSNQNAALGSEPRSKEACKPEKMQAGVRDYLCRHLRMYEPFLCSKTRCNRPIRPWNASVRVQNAACRSDQGSFCTYAVPLHRTEAMMHCDLER